MLLTKDEVAGWIRKLIPYLERPTILSPEGVFDIEEYETCPGKVITYGDALIPSNCLNVLTQTENLKTLVELYKVAKENKPIDERI